MRSRDSSSMVKFCIAKAAECRRAAEQALDEAGKRTWLRMEGEWFFLARSYDNEGRELMAPNSLAPDRCSRVHLLVLAPNVGSLETA